jgi:hypothetical protein
MNWKKKKNYISVYINCKRKVNYVLSGLKCVKMGYKNKYLLEWMVKKRLRWHEFIERNNHKHCYNHISQTGLSCKASYLSKTIFRYWLWKMVF